MFSQNTFPHTFSTPNPILLIVFEIALKSRQKRNIKMVVFMEDAVKLLKVKKIPQSCCRGSFIFLNIFLVLEFTARVFASKKTGFIVEDSVT